MRRRPKVMLLEDGQPWDGIVPGWALEFRQDDWPGYHPWEQWDAWWAAAGEWAEKHMPNGLDELIQQMPELPPRPWDDTDI